MGFFDGLLGPLTTQAANARASYVGGQQQGQADQVKQAIQLLTLKRQQDADALKEQLTRAQIGHLGAQTAAAGQVPVTYKADAEGNVRGLPTKVAPAELTQPDAPTPAIPGPPKNPPADGTTGATVNDQSETPVSPAVNPMLSAAQDSTKAKPFGISTGMKQPVKPVPSVKIDPRSVQGISADSTRAVNNQAAKVNNPLPVRASSARIDPLSPEGISADSTKKANAATIKADMGGGELAAPMAAKVGQFGEMIKKAHDLLPSMDALNVKLGASAAQDIAANGVGIGHTRIPGTQGVGSLLLNRTPEYAQYQAALSPFILAAAHALSGARINNEQILQIRASIEIKPGDSDAVRKQKLKNVVDLMNSIGGSLPQDAVGQQEGQMDPAEIALIEGYGYKRGRLSPRGGGRGSAPAKGSPSLVDQYNAAVAHLRATGRDAEIASLPKPPGVP